MRNGDGIHAKYIPGTYRTLANKGNDYLMDREAQKQNKTFSGIEGIAAQDFSLQESMGDIADRTKERLGTSDAAIILARRRLLAALDTMEDEVLPGIDVADQRVRSTSMLLPKDVPFHEGANQAVQVVPGTDFVSI
jgi:hypothetical protein